MQRVLEKGTGVYVVDKVIVVDCGAVCHTAMYAYQNLSTKDGLPTGILFGFFSLVYAMAFSHACPRFAFCWDSQNSKRRELYPEYKANRVKSEELIESYKQFEHIRTEVLPSLGFANSFIQDGYEADDLIASICRNNEGKKYIASLDHDLYQLLDEETCLIKPNSSEARYTLSRFREQYGIEPEEWVLVKAMAGCSTDNVKGIPNVGEIRAVKHLTGKYQWQCTGREAEKIIHRNLRLVRLPMKGTKKILLKEKEHLDFDKFYQMCEKYQFKKFLHHIDSWELFFAGEIPQRRLKNYWKSPKFKSKMPTLGLV